MADRSTYELKVVKSDMQLLTAKLKGGGAADMTLPESGNMGGGEVSAATRTGTGTFSLKFRKLYPELKSWLRPGVIGSTAGLSARLSAIDVTAGTATLVCEVGAVATDPATTDEIDLAWIVRNSGFNK